MKIAIIGAGAVGVTTAHVLSQSGHTVHVFEQASSAAQGASFAHGGAYGAASVQPFFSPQFTQQWALSLLGKPKRIHWTGLSRVQEYVLAAKAAWLSRSKVHATTAVQLQRLAQFSAATAQRYAESKRLAFEQARGLLVLHTQAAAFELASTQAQALNADIIASADKIKVLSVEQVTALEPALAKQPQLLGAILYPNEGYGNCALFTKQLKLQHETNGGQGGVLSDVQYRLNTAVSRLEAVGSRWLVHTVGKPSQPNRLGPNGSTPEPTPSDSTLFDAVCVTAGVGSPALLEPLGLRFPLLKTHAYSVTLPIQERMDAPNHCVLDAARGCALTPIGSRIRVTGLHQIGAKTRPNSAAFKALGHALHEWYPYASKTSEASYDSSASCITPDAKPLVGPTRLPGLYLNIAHGTHHWALSFGCAQAIADQLAHSPDGFDLSAFSPNRFA